MIIDIRLSEFTSLNDGAAITQKLRLAAADLGFRADIDGFRAARRRSHGPVLRLSGVRLLPGMDDSYRAFREPVGDKALGSRKNSVCYHGHREWMRALFRLYPDAIVESQVAVWDGVDDFEARHGQLSGSRSEACRCVRRDIGGEHYDPGHLERLESRAA